MNKADLVESVACMDGVASKAQAGRIVDGILETLGKRLKKDGEIRLAGFGNFTVKQRAARTARNPQSGETIQVPAKKAVTFKAASELKKALN